MGKICEQAIHKRANQEAGKYMKGCRNSSAVREMVSRVGKQMEGAANLWRFFCLFCFCLAISRNTSSFLSYSLVLQEQKF